MRPLPGWCLLSSVIGYYLHDLSPFLVRFSDSIGIRWYGLAYVAAFLVGFLLLRNFCRRGYCQLQPSQVGDFITMAALFGVLLGGRIGYMLFYNLDAFLQNPAIFFHFLQGGMASHGGILGLVVFTYIFARRKNISWRGLGDNLCTVAPVGLFLGRMANFINGELYGRKTDMPWAVQFPEEIREENFLSPDNLTRSDLGRELAPLNIPSSPSADNGNTEIIEVARDNEAVQEILRDYLNARHPSQIYQALLEGLALFLILYILRCKYPRLRPGILTGIFFIGYALFRIIGEVFREAADGYVGLFTRGQFLSLFMVVVGLFFIASAFVWPSQGNSQPGTKATSESKPKEPAS
ncbi:MAG: prolipoprotein diacylglyceryl transferase [Verrucomicrobiota bacterium]|nr:prolipoprotein diacylglyceryl transferase [Verrucomicrobiota bacterium]